MMVHRRQNRGLARLDRKKSFYLCEGLLNKLAMVDRTGKQRRVEDQMRGAIIFMTINPAVIPGRQHRWWW